MEKSLKDLLSDAFSDTSVLSFPEDEELDFERLDFKDETILSHGNNNTAEQEEEDISPLLETASTSVYQHEQEIVDVENNSQVCNSSLGQECNEADIDGDFMYKVHSSTQDNTGLNKDQYSSVLCQDNVAHKEDAAPVLKSPSIHPFKDDQEKLQAKNIQDVEVSVRPEDCTSSEEDSLEDEDKIKQKAGDFLETVHCCSKDEEQVFAMGQDQAQKENQNSNKKEGEIEEESYFESIRRKDSDLMIQDDTSEEEDEAESAKTMFFQVEYTLEYPEISYDEVEELTDEVDKMEDFSGDEHQEAGESFAEYPSDFSSCEYVNDARNAQECDFEKQLDCTAHSDVGEASKKGIQEVETNEMFLSNQPVIDCTGEKSIGHSDCYDKHEMGLMEMTNQDLCLKLPENKGNDVLQSWAEDAFSTWSKSEDTETSNANNTGINVACMLDSEYIDRRMSSRGSVDDGFFFSDEPKVSDAMTEGQIEDDEEEEEKRREQERIQAFYRFYDDEDGDRNREERQTKVQFCTETLSKVIHYDTESSERESLSCSSDEGEKDSDRDPDQTFEMKTCPSLGPNEEDLSMSQEPLENKGQAHKDLSNPPEIANTDLINKPICNRNHKCLSVVKMILSLFLAVVMGLLMFWWVADAEDWSIFVL